MFPGFEARTIATSGAAINVLPGGHFLPEELPDDTLASLRPFLDA